MDRIFMKSHYRLMIIFLFVSILELFLTISVEGTVQNRFPLEVGKNIRNSLCSAQSLSGNSQSPTINNFKVMEDLGMSQIKPDQRPKSDWIESEKALYRDLLKNSTYDILIVPFQVQGYAIDRVGRSLMTRYLSNHIEVLTNVKMPSPTLVARALGENARTFDDKEVYQLANDLKVKILIRGYVGHKRDEKMIVTLLVQVRDDNSFLSPETKATILNWQDIPFSDERPPSEVFLGLLDEIISRLPLKATNKPEVLVYKKVQQLPIPETVLSMVSRKPDSPVISTYHLQLLGMLFPEQRTAMEHLFERSLVSLTSVSPKSPDYALLKARAYFYLYRRPAALTALGTPSTPEEKAFLALLNGNLSELKKWVDEIKSPLHKLMAQIELNEQRWSYKQHLSNETYEDITGKFPDWKMVITRRLQSKDQWDVQSNIEVKLKLDEVFPIPAFTAKDLAISRMTLSESPIEGEDIEFSVYNHNRKLFASQGKKFCCVNDGRNLVERDYLDLLSAIGESNLLKNVRHQLFIQHLPESALQILNRYEMVYRGHPEMTYLKAETAHKLSDRKKNQSHEHFLKVRKESAYNAYYWSQGQTKTSHECFYWLGLNLKRPFEPPFYWYDADYPRRYYWDKQGEGDRKVFKNSYLSDINIPYYPWHKKEETKNEELALLYTHKEFLTLRTFYDFLLSVKKHYASEQRELDVSLEKKIKRLLEANRNRFVGHPGLIKLLAEMKEQQDNGKEATSIYEEAITANPDVWKPYKELGNMYIRQGDFKNALATFQRYPLFKGGHSGNMVQMSNLAHGAALQLWWCGAVDESIPLFRLASNSNTGSAAEMASSGILALLEQDYPKAAFHFLQLIKRYNNKFGYRDYMTMLHLMGYHKEAWSVFNSINIISNSPYIWTSAFIGHRMEAKTDLEITQWLLKKDIKQDPIEYFANIDKYLLMNHLIDRSVNARTAKRIEEVRKKLVIDSDMLKSFLKVIIN